MFHKSTSKWCSQPFYRVCAILFMKTLRRKKDTAPLHEPRKYEDNLIMLLMIFNHQYISIIFQFEYKIYSWIFFKFIFSLTRMLFSCVLFNWKKRSNKNNFWNGAYKKSDLICMLYFHYFWTLNNRKFSWKSLWLKWIWFVILKQKQSYYWKY